MNRTHLPIFNYRVSNSGSSCDIYIDGEIVDAGTQQFYKEYWGDDTSVSFKSFRDSVAATDASTYNVYINSVGGQVTEAMAIHDLLVGLQNKGKTVNTIGQGLIASAATYILMAGNSTITENSWFMIHNVSGWAWGDVDDMENQVRTLRKFNNKIRDFYAQATGKNATEIEELMAAETWYTGDEAKEAGFVKNVTGAVEFTNKISPDSWSFKNKTVLSAYNSALKKAPSMETNAPAKEENAFFNAMKKFFTGDNKTSEDKPKNEAASAETPSKEDIQKMVNEAVNNANKPILDALEKLVKNSTEDAKDSGKKEAEQAEDAPELDEEGSQEVADEQKEDEKEPSETEKEIADLKNQLKKLKNQVVNKIGGPAKPGSSKTNSAADDDPYDHEGVTWE